MDAYERNEKRAQMESLNDSLNEVSRKQFEIENSGGKFNAAWQSYEADKKAILGKLQEIYNAPRG